MTTMREWLTLAALPLIALPAVAHHSPAAFDMTRDEVLEGTVTDVDWRNPHVYIDLEVAGADGEPVERHIEAGPPSNLVPLGVGADSLRPGERVVVQVKPARSGDDRIALGWLLTKADGTVIPLHVRAAAQLPARAPSVAEAASIAGTWVPQARGFSSLAVAARAWPLTDAGRAAVEETLQARLAARAGCVPFGPPALMSLPSTTVVAVGDDEVTFTLDVMDVRRVVHLDQRSHPTPLPPSLLGHSIGHWEGDTLVVDTAGFAAHPEGYAFDLPSSAAKRVVERFTLSADGKHLDYEAVVEDRQYLAEPVSHRAQWDYRPEQRPSGLPCDPEVAGRFLSED